LVILSTYNIIKTRFYNNKNKNNHETTGQIKRPIHNIIPVYDADYTHTHPYTSEVSRFKNVVSPFRSYLNHWLFYCLLPNTIMPECTIIIISVILCIIQSLFRLRLLMFISVLDVTGEYLS